MKPGPMLGVGLILLGVGGLFVLGTNHYQSMHLADHDEEIVRAAKRDDEILRLIVEGAQRQREMNVAQMAITADLARRLSAAERRLCELDGKKPAVSTSIDHAVDLDHARRELMKGKAVLIPKQILPAADD